MTESRSLKEALDGLRFAMVATPHGDLWRSRPLTLAEQDDDVLRFLVPVTADWVAALEGSDDTPTSVTFSDPHKNHYVALQGAARTVRDRALIDRLWTPAASVFFTDRDDPTLRVLEADVFDGEWWDGPSGRVGQMIAIARAAVGAEPGARGRIAP